MLWTIKHLPRNTSDIIGNTDAVCRLKKWALSFSLTNSNKPILMHGPPGCGKSASAIAIASEMDWEIIRITPPEKSEIDKWEKRLGELFAGSSLFGNTALILCEDIDKWHLSKIRGLIQKFTAQLKDTHVPVIISAQDAYTRRLSPLRPYCELLQFKAINHSDILGALAKIANEHSLKIEKEQMQKIALNSQGDLRAAINDLQAKNFNSNRESEKKQFDILRMVFRSPSYKATRWADLGPLMERSTLKLFTSENMPAELFNINDMVRGFEFLSRSDIFDGRVRRRQYWGYLRYSSSLLLWGISSSRRHIRAGFVPYAFPSYIRKMGATRSKRAIYKNAGAKIAPKCHCTTKHSRSYISLIHMQMNSTEQVHVVGKKLCAYYKFDEDELASICEVSQNNLYSSNPKRKKS